MLTRKETESIWQEKRGEKTEKNETQTEIIKTKEAKDQNSPAFRARIDAAFATDDDDEH